MNLRLRASRREVERIESWWLRDNACAPPSLCTSADDTQWPIQDHALLCLRKWSGYLAERRDEMLRRGAWCEQWVEHQTKLLEFVRRRT
jgi:hypothetical protein